METVEQTLTEQQRHWLAELRACEASGKTMVQYAADHGLEVRTLYHWKKALVKKGVLPRTRGEHFQRARVVPGTGGHHEWRIQMPNGIGVTFTGTVDGDMLATVLNAAVGIG